MLPPGLTEGIILRLAVSIGGAVVVSLIARALAIRVAVGAGGSAKAARGVWQWLARMGGERLAVAVSFVLGVVIGPVLSVVGPGAHAWVFPDGDAALVAYEADAQRVATDARAIEETGVSGAGVEEYLAREDFRLERARRQVGRVRENALLPERLCLATIGFVVVALTAWRRRALGAIAGASVLLLLSPSGDVWALAVVGGGIAGVSLRESVSGWRSWGWTASRLAWCPGAAVAMTLVASRLGAGEVLVAVPMVVLALAARSLPLPAWTLPIACMGWLWLGGPEAHELATVGACVLIAAAGNPLTRP